MVVGGWNGPRRVRSVLSKAGFGGSLPVYGELVRRDPVVAGSATPALDPTLTGPAHVDAVRRGGRSVGLSSPPRPTGQRRESPGN